MTSITDRFWDACTAGDLALAMTLINDPTVNPNHQEGRERGDTPFHRACRFGHSDLVEQVFLKRQNDPHAIDLNPLNAALATPFFLACQHAHEETVNLLVNDERIDINQAKSDGTTPLWFASQCGHLSVVQKILASGKQVDTERKSMPGSGGWNDKTAAECAVWAGSFPYLFSNLAFDDLERRKKNCPFIAELILGYAQEPKRVRDELRRLPGIREKFIGEVFSLVIFFSDDFLALKPLQEKDKEGVQGKEKTAQKSAMERTTRFFLIVLALPMELQMAVCNRIYGCGKDVVLIKYSEPGFRKVVKWFSREGEDNEEDNEEDSKEERLENGSKETGCIVS
jgi:hypothetical protein